ncbi:hypothetical protein PSTT_16665 [Puccinia striiformis]|uniref:SWIM-type domain-containing protein n=1 Tax=Puccinia striiformis TaxID=27350 RepID=A0A2S4UBU0_9BASI|nr:hypothetical protein PSTT_16665 [Puccinia striiformis]
MIFARFHVPQRAAEAHKEFCAITYSSASPDDRLALFISKWSAVNPRFTQYVLAQWAPNTRFCSLHLRTTAHQGIHTNNYTDAWHAVLKKKFLPPKGQRRIDEVVQVLVNRVEGSYRWTPRMVEAGFHGQQANKFQQRAKRTAGGLSAAWLRGKGVKIFRGTSHFVINSFSSPNTTTYRVAYNQSGSSLNGCLTHCTCPHFARLGHACKHMYLIARRQRMLVVESVPQKQPCDALPPVDSPLALLSEDDGSDVEFVAAVSHPILAPEMTCLTPVPDEIEILHPLRKRPDEIEILHPLRKRKRSVTVSVAMKRRGAVVQSTPVAAPALPPLDCATYPNGRVALQPPALPAYKHWLAASQLIWAALNRLKLSWADPMQLAIRSKFGWTVPEGFTIRSNSAAEQAN